MGTQPSDRGNHMTDVSSGRTDRTAGHQFNLADLFELVADIVPGRDALVADPERRTYAQLDERANRFAHHLRSLDLAVGAHVGILARNRAEWAEAMIGSYKSRLVPVNLNFRYVAPELRYVVENADLVVLVYERSFGSLVSEALDGIEAPPSLIEIGDGGSGAGREPPRGPGPGAIAFEDALAASSPRRGFGPRSPDDRYLLFTGGTTGMPKGVMWRQEDIYFAAMGGNGWGGPPVAEPSDVGARLPMEDADRNVMLVVGPLMHGNAQWAMWNGLLMGGTVVLYTEHHFAPEVILGLTDRERVVSWALVGDAMARPLAAAVATNDGRFDLSSLFVVASGGAMLSPTVREELVAQLPDRIIMDRFGSSEAGAQGAVEGEGKGPHFVMSDDTTVLDDDLRPLTPGDGRTGRLARRGRIPLGYYRDEAKTAATFPVDADGVRWSLPGDLASVDPDGTILVLGRGSSSINSGGEKVFPEEVEAAVTSHPDVFGAIVVGVPDERFGEQVAVAVRPRAGSTLSLESLQKHCRGVIAGYKVPRRMVIVEELPMTAAGKPDAKATKALF